MLLKGERSCVLSVVTAWLKVKSYKREILRAHSPIGLLQEHSSRRSRLTNLIFTMQIYRACCCEGKVCRLLLWNTFITRCPCSPCLTLWIISTSCSWDEVRDGRVACISAAVLSKCTSSAAAPRIIYSNQPLTHKPLHSLPHHHFKLVHCHPPLSAARLGAHHDTAPLNLRD